MKKQIDKIREYFKGLTITLDNIVLITKFPDGWILGLSDGLLEDFKCEVRNMQDGVYFVDQFENGYEEIFKCVNTIISVNKEMEAKSALLKQKAKELSELFLNSSLEELQNLKFEFISKQSEQKTKQTKKTKQKVEKIINSECIVEDDTVEDEIKETVAVNNLNESCNSVSEKTSSILELAEKIVK